MADLGYATLPRGMRIPTLSSGHITSNGHLPNGHLPNGHLPNGHLVGGATTTCHAPKHVPVVSINSIIPNGSVTANGCAGGRAVHDGFATIRSGGSKRGRARSSPSVVGENRSSNQCHHGCCPTSGRTWAMEPLWEEKCSLEPSGAPQVTRRDRQQLPWWEIATRRSRYRSCPAFSQASVVNALEQTMSNVTNRLERLASSPDLKESEAAELRKTAAVLRQQSSAVCQSVSSGCLTMERQLSCDSVSSATSTVSGASLSSFASMASRSVPGTLSQHYGHNQFHHQADTLNSSDNSKIKKRSWLRSSFRRAFGRHGRKRSKQTEGNLEEAHELPMHHTVNSAVKHLSPPPPPSSFCTLVKHKHSSLKSLNKETFKPQEYVAKDEHKSSLEESDVVARLRQEVAEKERELTDCRLEVLSTQHQLQSQADTITRLQAEVTGLREENSKMLSLIRGQCSPTSDALLTPLSHTLNALTLNPGSTSGNNLALVSGRQVKVMVVEQSDLTSVKSAAIISIKPSYLTHIGNINVESKTTWEEFDKLIANTVKDYGNRIDPVSALGLDNESILCYRVDDIVRAPDLPLPELLPYGYCVGSVDALHVWLKGGNHKKDGDTVGDVSLAAFSSVTPASSLKRLASQLTEHRRLLLAGPPASGKSSLAQTLAEFFITSSGREYTNDAIQTFKVTGSNTLELCQLLSNMWPRGLLTSSSHSTSSMSSNISASSSSSVNSNATSPEADSAPPAVIIIDDLHAAGGVVETLQRCLPTSVHIGPAIIATSCPTAALSTRLNITCNFKWAALSIQQEPVRGLLGRVLRRRVVAAEVAANTRLPDAHHLAEWLTRLWLHLNTLLSGHCSSHEVGVGPGLLMDSPLGQEETQVWFTEVWNTRLVPYIKETVRSSSSPNTSIFDTWTDPLDWVLATYPWPVNAACGPDQLARITASDIGKQEGSLLNRKMSPHQPFVPLSVCQQIRKAESIYSTPQLLSLGGLNRAGAHGTGQTVFTSKDIKAVSPYQASVPADNEDSERKDSANNVYNTVNKVNTVHAIYNSHHENKPSVKDCEWSENTVGNCPIETGLDGRDISNTHKVITNNKEDLVNDLGITSEKSQIYMKSIVHSNLSDNNNAYSSVPSLFENDGNEKQEMNEDEMESDPIPVKLDNALPYLFNGYVNSFTNNIIDCKDVPMDMECKTEHFDSHPKNLDVLAKNAINSNGLSNDCVKIIREPGAKIDIRGISNELTSTFKPSETAM